MRKKLLFGLFSSSAFCLTFLCLFFFSCFRLYGRNDSKEDMTAKIHNYKYSVKDYDKNEVSRGFVTFPDNIKDESFLSFFDSTENRQVLISPFGSKEYECLGSCVCESHESKRRNAIGGVFVRKLSYLLAAVSSTVALKVAEKHFSQTCEVKFSSMCESQSIKSEIEECKSLDDSDKSSERKRFLCRGHCVDSAHSELYKPTLTLEEKIDCEKLTLEVGDIWVDFPFQEGEEGEARKKNGQSKEEIARVRFQVEYMRDFCRKKSRIPWVEENEGIFKGEPYTGFTIEEDFLCAGSNKHDKSLSTNVQCLPM